MYYTILKNTTVDECVCVGILYKKKQFLDLSMVRST